MSSKQGLGVALLVASGVGCGPPELSNQTPTSVVYQEGVAQVFTAQLTRNGNDIDEVNLIANFAQIAMTGSLASTATFSADYEVPDCQLVLPYTYRIHYESNLPSEPTGLQIRREPSAGAYVLRRTGSTPNCRTLVGRRFDVNTTTDLVDVLPGNGVCATQSGSCSLRAAIMETNALSGHDYIQVPTGTYLLSIHGVEEVDEPDDTVGDLDVTDGVTIVGQSSDTTIIDGDLSSRHFQIVTDVNQLVNLSNMTLENGLEIGAPGGAVYASSNVKLERVVMMDNHLSANGEGGSCGNSVSTKICNRGGAVFNEGRLLLRACTVRGNGTCLGATVCDTGQAGAIANFGSTARLFLEDSTITENTARFIGALQNHEGRIEAVNSTFTGNVPLHWVTTLYTTGGEVDLRHVTISEREALPIFLNSDGSGEETALRIESSIVEIDGDGGTLCTGSLESVNNNFVGGFDPDQDYLGSCDVSGLGPTVGKFALLSLADNGGPTETMLVSETSDELGIVDHGSAVCPNRDQRGDSRTGAADGAGKLGCDPGAVEH